MSYFQTVGNLLLVSQIRQQVVSNIEWQESMVLFFETSKINVTLLCPLTFDPYISKNLFCALSMPHLARSSTDLMLHFHLRSTTEFRVGFK